MPSLEPSTPGPTQSCYIQVPNSAAAIPTASSDLQRRAVIEPCRMSVMPSQVPQRTGKRDTFWTLSVWIEETLMINPTNIPLSSNYLNSFLYSNQGRCGFRVHSLRVTICSTNKKK
jgi:hypothetical protein